MATIAVAQLIASGQAPPLANPALVRGEWLELGRRLRDSSASHGVTRAQIARAIEADGPSIARAEGERIRGD